MTPPRLHLKTPLVGDLAVVDGLARTGKMLMGKLVSNLKRADHFMQPLDLEYMAIMDRLGLLDEHNAAAMFRMVLDQMLYDRMVGRNLNTRLGDSSSVLKSTDYGELLARTHGPEGWTAVNAFNDKRRFQVLMTHVLLPSFAMVQRAVPDLRMIQMVRHPVDVVASWAARDWGRRFGVDALALNPTVAIGEAGSVPWWAVEWGEEYLGAIPMDRIIRSVLTLMELGEQRFATLDEAQRARIRFVAYEPFARAPLPELVAIADFLETEPHSNMNVVALREGLPRDCGGAAGRMNKFGKIREEASPELAERLMAASREYQERWGVDGL